MSTVAKYWEKYRNRYKKEGESNFNQGPDSQNYISFLEVQLERLNNAVSQTQNFSERIEQLSQQIITAEDKVLNLTRLVKLQQNYCDGQEEEIVQLKAQLKGGDGQKIRKLEDKIDQLEDLVHQKQAKSRDSYKNNEDQIQLIIQSVQDKFESQLSKLEKKMQNMIQDNAVSNDAWKIEDRLNDQIIRVGRKAEDNIQKVEQRLEELIEEKFVSPGDLGASTTSYSSKRVESKLQAQNQRIESLSSDLQYSLDKIKGLQDSQQELQQIMRKKLQEIEYGSPSDDLQEKLGQKVTSSVERFGGIIKKYGDAIKTLNKDFKDLDRRTGRVEKKVEGILDEQYAQRTPKPQKKAPKAPKSPVFGETVSSSSFNISPNTKTTMKKSTSLTKTPERRRSLTPKGHRKNRSGSNSTLKSKAMDESIHAKIKKNKQAELTERQKIKKVKEGKSKKQRRSKLEQIYQQLKSRQNQQKMGCQICSRFKNTKKVNLAEKPIQTSSVITLRRGTFARLSQKSLEQTYGMIEIINQGKFGALQKVQAKYTKATRTVKSVLKTRLPTQDDQKQLFYAKFQQLYSSDHPNISKIFDCYEDSSYLHVVGEYLEGGSIADLLNTHNTLNEQLAAHYGFQLLSAIQYLHELDIFIVNLDPLKLVLDQHKTKPILKLSEYGTSLLQQACQIPFDVTYFTAPEVCQNQYCKESDIWSCGVIIYYLIAGYPPFVFKNQQEAIQIYNQGVTVKFDPTAFYDSSEDLIDLLTQMLVQNQSQRIQAKDLIEHSWFKKRKFRNSTSVQTKQEALRRMKEFNSRQKLQKAAFAYIANQLVNTQEQNGLIEVFRSIDTNGDGKLSIAELETQYQKFMPRVQAVQTVHDIMRQVDIDRNGYIEYTEFLMASSRRETLLNEDYLELAFKLFDRSGQGQIGANDLYEVLGELGQSQEYGWEDLIEQVDKDGNGLIDMQEFKEMMVRDF